MHELHEGPEQWHGRSPIRIIFQILKKVTLIAVETFPSYVLVTASKLVLKHVRKAEWWQLTRFDLKRTWLPGTGSWWFVINEGWREAKAQKQLRWGDFRLPGSDRWPGRLHKLGGWVGSANHSLVYDNAFAECPRAVPWWEPPQKAEFIPALILPRARVVHGLGLLLGGSCHGSRIRSGSFLSFLSSEIVLLSSLSNP